MEMVIRMKNSNPASYAIILDNLPPTALASLKKLIDIDNNEKPKRVFRKILGIRTSDAPVDIESLRQTKLKQRMENESD